MPANKPNKARFIKALHLAFMWRSALTCQLRNNNSSRLQDDEPIIGHRPIRREPGQSEGNRQAAKDHEPAAHSGADGVVDHVEGHMILVPHDEGAGENESPWNDGPEALEAEPMTEECTIDDFVKVDLRVARVIEAKEGEA